jgi:hypothetical protein
VIVVAASRRRRSPQVHGRSVIDAPPAPSRHRLRDASCSIVTLSTGDGTGIIGRR